MLNTARPFHRPPLSSRGQSSWLQIQSSAFDFRHYQILWEVVNFYLKKYICFSVQQLLRKILSVTALRIAGFLYFVNRPEF
jgi:hypothetical protein